MKQLTMKLPKGICGRWWAEVFQPAKPGTDVFVDKYWDMTEVNLNDNRITCIAIFRSHKHALEFCKINKLKIMP